MMSCILWRLNFFFYKDPHSPFFVFKEKKKEKKNLSTKKKPNEFISKMAFTCSDIIKIFFAVILPPVGVMLERGCGPDFCINILLTLLGYIPGTYLTNK